MKGVAYVVLAAGEGKRMHSRLPKAAHELCGLPLVRHVLLQARDLQPERSVVVVGRRDDEVAQAVAGLDVRLACQEERLGTGHAAAQAESELADFDGDVIVTCGDIPLVRPETICELVERHRAAHVTATVLSAHVKNPYGYGRIVRDGLGRVTGIVEQTDADEQTAAINEINTGIYCFRSRELFKALPLLSRANVQGEYYLTDVIGEFVKMGRPVGAYAAPDPEEVMGINTRAQLAHAERVMRNRVRQRVMEAGATLTDPATTFMDVQVQVGQDTTLYPGVSLLGETRIGEGCLIESHASIRDSVVGSEVHIGSGAVLTGCRIAAGVRIGPGSHLGP